MRRARAQLLQLLPRTTVRQHSRVWSNAFSCCIAELMDGSPYAALMLEHKGPCARPHALAPELAEREQPCLERHRLTSLTDHKPEQSHSTRARARAREILDILSHHKSHHESRCHTTQTHTTLQIPATRASAPAAAQARADSTLMPPSTMIQHSWP